MTRTTVNLPLVLDGIETKGPTNNRPKNAPVGFPYWDTDLDLWLVMGSSGWELVNGGSADPSAPPAPDSAEFDEGTETDLNLISSVDVDDDENIFGPLIDLAEDS